MKLRNKLLVALAPAATIATITPIALTSCATNQAHITFSGDKKITTDVTSLDLEFTLANELGSDETLEVTPSKFVGAVTPSIKSRDKKKVIVNIDISAAMRSVITFDLLFKAKNSSSTILAVWEETISGFEITYTGK